MTFHSKNDIDRKIKLLFYAFKISLPMKNLFLEKKCPSQSIFTVSLYYEIKIFQISSL